MPEKLLCEITVNNIHYAAYDITEDGSIDIIPWDFIREKGIELENGDLIYNESKILVKTTKINGTL